MTIEHDVAAMIQHAVDCFGRLDCLFNNAASASTFSGITDIDIQRFNAAMAVHVGGVLLGMKVMRHGRNLAGHGLQRQMQSAAEHAPILQSKGVALQ